MTSFQIKAQLRPEQDPMIIGLVTSVHCPECYRYHFIATSVDGWTKESDAQGEPLSAAAAADILLEHQLAA